MRTNMPHVDKKGIRVLGISESFIKNKSKTSILAGLIMRADLVIDGFSFSKATVGGMDATECVLEIYQKLGREDINLVFLNGCVISWFNIIDLKRFYRDIARPVICITYEKSEGLEKYFVEYFGNEAEDRIAKYKENGEREEFKLHTGKIIFARYLGLNREDVIQVINKFTLHGSIPEPLRVARLLARTLVHQMPKQY
ncbi:endonuclease dU [[Eubacterium] cellulosolvens]